ncbi:Hypothetical protein CINCED_3A004247 [Cinara cedri]|uniref:Uncharacterized protein n=1 Tax=Cinara cedri TaxID=506608 RepID=A0A5E4M2T1_9HEMI|nr:Hypothetical protein CINCED_3A004247 [Cinara cedri]
MVYSSDFYTSRRPAYYKPASSYSVTPLYSSDGYDLPPTYYKAHQVYQTCTTPAPFILTPPLSTGKPSPNVLPYNGYPYYHHQYTPLHRRSAAAIHGVLDRIEHRPRSHPSYDPTDEFLNSRSATTFDDVKRDIRAQTAGLLKQVYTPTFRPKMSSVSNTYSEMPIAQRIESDAYIEKILADSDSYRRENNIGKGHLACVSYAGGKAYPRRRPHLSTEVDDNITMLSYYNKTREAAAASSPRSSVKISKAEKQYDKKPLSEQSENESVETVRLAAINEAAKEEEARLVAEKEKTAALLIAEKEAARLVAEEEEAKIEERRLALEKEADEKARLVAEEERAVQLALEKEAEEKARLVAEEERAVQLALEKEAEEKAQLLAEEESAAQLKAEKEYARLAAEEEEHRLAIEKKAEETARLAVDEEERSLTLKKETDETAQLLTLEKDSEDPDKSEQVDNEITFEEIIEVSAVSICELAESTPGDIDELEIKDTNNEEFDTEPEEVAQAEGQESTEEEDESEDEDD